MRKNVQTVRQNGIEGTFLCCSDDGTQYVGLDTDAGPGSRDGPEIALPTGWVVWKEKNRVRER